MCNLLARLGGFLGRLSGLCACVSLGQLCILLGRLCVLLGQFLYITWSVCVHFFGQLCVIFLVGCWFHLISCLAELFGRLYRYFSVSCVYHLISCKCMYHLVSCLGHTLLAVLISRSFVPFYWVSCAHFSYFVFLISSIHNLCNCCVIYYRILGQLCVIYLVSCVHFSVGCVFYLVSCGHCCSQFLVSWVFHLVSCGHFSVSCLLYLVS